MLLANCSINFDSSFRSVDPDNLEDDSLAQCPFPPTRLLMENVLSNHIRMLSSLDVGAVGDRNIVVFIRCWRIAPLSVAVSVECPGVEFALSEEVSVVPALLSLSE